MPDKELHYLTYEPEAMWDEMLDAYIDAGGDVIYPGDEKDYILRGVQEILARAYAAHDHAARRRTLRYGTLDDLILNYGEPRQIPYNDAVPASGLLLLTFGPLIERVTMDAGELLTADGIAYWALTEQVIVGPSATVTTATAQIRCSEPGVVGNGFTAGTEMQPVLRRAQLRSAVLTTATAGGRAAEDVEAYRERLRVGNAYALTTGTMDAYRSRAMAVSADVVDARAVVPSGGVVEVALLIEASLNEAQRNELITRVQEALSPDAARPMTDHVTVHEAEALAYNLIVHYKADAMAAQDAILTGADEYKAWQEGALGRAFDPFNLVARLYQAGATRVAIDEESSAAGEAAEYREILPDQCWKGAVIMEEME